MSQANQTLSYLFAEMSDVLEILGVDRFRVNAFRRASRVLDGLTDDIASIGPDIKALTGIEGIGKGTAQRIAEFLETGNISDREKLMSQIPEGLMELLSIPGLGPKTIGLIWKQAGVESLGDLKEQLQHDDLAELPGLGPKKLENIRKSISFAESSSDRVHLGTAMSLAHWFVSKFVEFNEVQQVEYAGSLRRGQETIGDVDLIVAADPKSAKTISDAFKSLTPVTEVLVNGTTKTSVRTTDGLQVDLRIVPPESYGAALMYFTGSKEHNIVMRQRAISRKMRLNEYGLLKGKMTVAGRTEKEIYQALDLAPIPPELRENRGEFNLAESDELPHLIKLSDIRSELHAHTIASDGKWTIKELALAAAERGFHTIAVTDHSKGQAQANGLTNERLEQHISEIRQVADQLKKNITILAGSEVDILSDGKLDYPNSLLEQLDVVVASPHAALSQDPKKATTRLIQAIENPHVTILGHPTGRLLLRRKGLSPDMRQVIAAAYERGIAIEINANTWRLDLRDTHARAAIEAGVKLSINTDAHGPGDMDQLLFGVMTARRAGATKHDVINCLSREALNRWIKGTKLSL